MRGIHRSTMNPVYIFAPRDEFKKKTTFKNDKIFNVHF